MRKIYLILGYGTPRNIFKDENYNFYLKMVFNRVYDDTINKSIVDPFIIFSGGNTDMIKPYKRTEADEMMRFFKKLASRRGVHEATCKWRFITERKSISSLENILQSKEILQKRKIGQADITLFCEHTRKRRVSILSKKLFSKNLNINVEPIDFDVSPNRYLDSEFLKKKERVELKHCLWALKSPENLEKHHKFFVEKIAYLRKAGPKAHVKAVKQFWQEKLRELET